jgi:hypothetical protein
LALVTMSLEQQLALIHGGSAAKMRLSFAVSSTRFAGVVRTQMPCLCD